MTIQPSKKTVPFLTQEVLKNPYVVYNQLQDLSPVYFDEGFGMWVITRYEDVYNATRDPRFSSAVHGPAADVPDALKPLLKLFNNSLAFLDDPAHGRIRRLVHKAFTPAVIANMASAIQDTTNALVQDILKQEVVDLRQALAFPLPIFVISSILDVPQADQEDFGRWARGFMASTNPSPSIEELMLGVQATLESGAYLNALIEERRGKNGQDLLSRLIAAEEEGDALSNEELISLVVLLLIAGHETTVGIIQNGTLALLRNPDQWNLLKSDPSLVRSAVEEMLRYDPAVHILSRAAKEDMEIAGQHIKKGERIGLMVGAANHDPRKFENPNTLDIRRNPNPHMTFGGGIHFCVGAPLARLELQIVFETIIRCLPNIQLVEPEQEYAPSIVVRALNRLLVYVNADV